MKHDIPHPNTKQKRNISNSQNKLLPGTETNCSELSMQTLPRVLSLSLCHKTCLHEITRTKKCNVIYKYLKIPSKNL